MIKVFTTGNINVIQEDSTIERKHTIPDAYKGKIFDKEGNCLDYFPESQGEMFSEDGKLILGLNEGKIITDQKELDEIKNKEATRQEKFFSVSDPNRISDYTCFSVKLPSYLPEGVRFEKASFFEEGTPKDSLYVALHFVNEQNEEVIYMQQRFVCEETGIETGTDGEVKEVDVNGATGLRYDNCLDWEDDEVMYMMNFEDNQITEDEMLKIARSFK